MFIKYIKKKNIKNNTSDYFLVFHKQDKNIFKRFFRSKFITTGSVRNNNYISKNKNKSNIINYISQYNPKKKKT